MYLRYMPEYSVGGLLQIYTIGSDTKLSFCKDSARIFMISNSVKSIINHTRCSRIDYLMLG